MEECSYHKKYANIEQDIRYFCIFNLNIWIIKDDIKTRAGDFKDIEIIADNLLSKVSDYKVDVKIYFYNSESCDKCIKGYNESVLEGSTLQCFR